MDCKLNNKLIGGEMTKLLLILSMLSVTFSVNAIEVNSKCTQDIKEKASSLLDSPPSTFSVINAPAGFVEFTLQAYHVKDINSDSLVGIAIASRVLGEPNQCNVMALTLVNQD